MWGTRKIVPLLVFLPSTIPFLNPLTIGASLEASIPTGSVQSPTYSSPGSTNKWSVTIPTNIKVVEVQDVGKNLLIM